MANILIRHAELLTLDEAAPLLRRADVAIAGEFITGVGEAPAGFEPDEVVDGTGHIVMPGLYNGHIHSGTVLRRGTARGDEPYVAPDGESAFWAAQLAMAEMIRCGTVGFADHYFYMDRVAEAVSASGMRAVLSWCTYTGAAPLGRNRDVDDGVIGGDLPAVARFAEAWNGAGHGRIRTALGPHSVYRCSPMFLARSAAVAARLGIGIHIHVAVTGAETEALLAEYGMTPVELLDRNGAFDVSVAAIHAIHLTHGDIDLLAERGACVVYCPSAHTMQGLGETAANVLEAAGVPVALGTDGADVAFTLNILQAVRDAARGRDRGGEGDRAQATLSALRMATRTGAEVLGFPLSGRIEAGYNADLILIDGRQAHLVPLLDPVAALGHAVVPGDISDVMVGGDWLLRKGELQTIDEAQVLYEVGRRIAA
jgi:5-methylthioadenosine/S-adenosylhomocysteine deaminase